MNDTITRLLEISVEHGVAYDDYTIMCAPSELFTAIDEQHAELAHMAVAGVSRAELRRAIENIGVAEAREMVLAAEVAVGNPFRPPPEPIPDDVDPREVLRWMAVQFLEDEDGDE
jgi:hypothetical protein